MLRWLPLSLPSSYLSQMGSSSAPPIPIRLAPGTRLYLRGPLGHGFKLPLSARRIALIAFDCSPRSLLALLQPAFQQDASVTLVSEMAPDDLPFQVEVQPLRALLEICKWADFVALDVSREFASDIERELRGCSLRAESPGADPGSHAHAVWCIRGLRRVHRGSWRRTASGL